MKHPQAIFRNFSDERFEGQWDGVVYAFEPGEAKIMDDYLAAHFAKHLANRELLKTPDGDRNTSPIEADTNPHFSKMFGQAFLGSVDQDELERREQSIIDKVLGKKKLKSASDELVGERVKAVEKQEKEDSKVEEVRSELSESEQNIETQAAVQESERLQVERQAEEEFEGLRAPVKATNYHELAVKGSRSRMEEVAKKSIPSAPKKVKK